MTKGYPKGIGSDKNALLTFTGFHDPYHESLITGEEIEGPILSLISLRQFHQVLLLSTPNTKIFTEKTKEAIVAKHPKTKVTIKHLPLKDPTDYSAIFYELRNLIGPLLEIRKGSNFFVCPTPGTPQMHACWLLLIAGGEFPATILQVNPKKFTDLDAPLVKEISLNEKGFPAVRAPIPDLEISQEIPSLRDAIRRFNIVGDHPAFINALEKCALLSEAECPILILGKSGTGKEIFARMSHELSSRREGPFVAVNCAAIPEKLAESILFGHVRGAFTGADKAQKGKISIAHGGALFLDELGELSLKIQAKLLRVLQDKIVEPLGASKGKRADVRIIAATNSNLKVAIAAGNFREDLYYRLNVGEILLPPLSERISDIPKLALHLLDKANQFTKYPKKISTEAINKLMNYHWPGNVRELQNVIERAVITTRDRVIAPERIEFFSTRGNEFLVSTILEDGFQIEGYMKDLRKKIFVQALEQSGGKQSKAAKLLGVTPQAVHQFVRENEI